MRAAHSHRRDCSSAIAVAACLVLGACTLQTQGELAGFWDGGSAAAGGFVLDASPDASYGGFTGQGGTLGQGGEAGQGGTGGQAGSAGQGGVGGQAGSAGQGGVGGQAGSAGQGGVSGQAGSAGQGGVAGQAGSAGQGGVGGQAGSGQGGAAGATCGPNEKLCAVCVPLGNPLNGCVQGTCTPCLLPNAVTDCSNSGACGIAGCNYGYESCDGLVGNGCETEVASSIDNCGACGQTCVNPHGTTVCAAKKCLPACDSGYGNCDGNGANGCETGLVTATDCGACGLKCIAGTYCQTGICTACTLGWLDCDLSSANGCEVNGQADPKNCGQCGKVCPTGFNCMSGICGCAANHANCNAGAPAGTFSCESLPGADKCKCSGVLCAFGQVCNASGACSG
jgi:hypothetical protein